MLLCGKYGPYSASTDLLPQVGFLIQDLIVKSKTTPFSAYCNSQNSVNKLYLWRETPESGFWTQDKLKAIFRATFLRNICTMSLLFLQLRFASITTKEGHSQFIHHQYRLPLVRTTREQTIWSAEKLVGYDGKAGLHFHFLSVLHSWN